MRHPETSFFEAVRISSFSFFILYKYLKMGFSRRPVEDTGLLRMTKWVDEIATSHNTLLATTEESDEILTLHKTLLRITEKVDDIARSPCSW
jgi:hypothetical protein